MNENLEEAVRRLGRDDFTQSKNRRKRVRTVLQVGVLLGVIALLISLFFTLKTYHPYDAAHVTEGPEDTGFIAISYFGVDRIGDTSTLIGKNRLREHLQALKDQGYVTVTQKDIEAYYNEGRPLPKRALFLMFEDGRRDTAIFAQDILEDLNDKATMMTYPEKFEKKDPKFLVPKELKEMEGSSFWELGTNGYRLEYINVFDRYDNYIGEIDPLKYSSIHTYLGRRYNHYLMDYIRDKNGMPKESYEHMKQRISYDYERLRDVYTDELGYVPDLYVLMHANTGKFGNNDQVSSVNEKWTRDLFQMNFNREGYCFNQRNSSIYDLTRMQPQPYWPINHLLMRVKYDINQPITFVTGDKTRQKQWELLDGASEIRQETYTLTTLPEGRGLARMHGSEQFTKNLRVSARFRGNAFGAQQIFLRADDTLGRYIEVELLNDSLVINEMAHGDKKEIYREKIAVINGEKILSVEEDKRDAEVTELQTFARYAESGAQAREYTARSEKRQAEPAASVADGGDVYEGTQSFHARSDHQIDITLRDQYISVTVDGNKAADNLEVLDTETGSLYLGAAWGGEAWSQRNLADDVYDGVFDKLMVYANDDSNKVLFSSELTGWEKMKFQVNQVWETVLNWFLKHL